MIEGLTSPLYVYVIKTHLDVALVFLHKLVNGATDFSALLSNQDQPEDPGDHQIYKLIGANFIQNQ